jgi:Cu+-exporting ATPase
LQKVSIGKYEFYQFLTSPYSYLLQRSKANFGKIVEAMETLTDEALVCYHCGNDCPDTHIHIEEKHFCCEGCKTVYEILDQNNLCNYYDIEKMSGNSPQMAHFEFLDNTEITNQLLDFRSDKIAKISFIFLPFTVHLVCIS